MNSYRCRKCGIIKQECEYTSSQIKLKISYARNAFPKKTRNTIKEIVRELNPMSQTTKKQLKAFGLLLDLTKKIQNMDLI